MQKWTLKAGLIGLVAMAGGLALSLAYPAYSDETSRVDRVLDRAAVQPIAASFVEQFRNANLKHPVDFLVQRLFATDPFFAKVQADIRKMQEMLTAQQRQKMLLNVGKAMYDLNAQGEGQYKFQLSLFREVQSKLKIPAPIRRNNSSLFIIPSKDVNAFTYSGVPEAYIDVVLNQGLVDVLTPEELAYVIGHEIGHIQSRHMETKLMMTALLITASRTFPDPKGEESAKAFEAKLIDGLLRESEEIAVREGASEISSMLMQLSNVMKMKLNGEAIGSLLASLVAQTLGEKHGFALRDILVKEHALNEAAQRMLMLAQLVHSRSCEISADRFGLLASEVQSARSAQAKLLGAGTNVEALMRQLKEFQKSRGAPEGAPVDPIKDPAVLGMTHPPAALRILALDAYNTSLPHRTVSDSFIQGTLMLDSLEQTLQAQGLPEEVRAELSTLRDDLREALLQDRNTNPRKVEALEKFYAAQKAAAAEAAAKAAAAEAAAAKAVAEAAAKKPAAPAAGVVSCEAAFL